MSGLKTLMGQAEDLKRRPTRDHTLLRPLQMMPRRSFPSALADSDSRSSDRSRRATLTPTEVRLHDRGLVLSLIVVNTDTYSGVARNVRRQVHRVDDGDVMAMWYVLVAILEFLSRTALNRGCPMTH